MKIEGCFKVKSLTSSKQGMGVEYFEQPRVAQEAARSHAIISKNHFYIILQKIYESQPKLHHNGS